VLMFSCFTYLLWGYELYDNVFGINWLWIVTYYPKNGQLWYTVKVSPTLTPALSLSISRFSPLTPTLSQRAREYFIAPLPVGEGQG